MLNIFNKEMMLKKKLIAFGDSVMKGVYMEDVDREGKPHYVIAKNSFIDEFGRRLGCDVSNYGRFGSTVTAVVREGETIDTFNATVVSKQMKDYDWTKNSKVTVKIEFGKNIPAVTYKFKVIEFSNRVWPLADKVVFGKE